MRSSAPKAMGALPKENCPPAATPLVLAKAGPIAALVNAEPPLGLLPKEKRCGDVLEGALAEKLDEGVRAAEPNAIGFVVSTGGVAAVSAAVVTGIGVDAVVAGAGGEDVVGVDLGASDVPANEKPVAGIEKVGAEDGGALDSPSSLFWRIDEVLWLSLIHI